MPGFGVCRANIDIAGGVILEGNPFFYVDGFPVSIEGNPVEDHGNNEHDAAVMIEGSSTFLFGGVPVCHTGSRASCGDFPTGSPTFFVGG